MPIYTLERRQTVHASLQRCWDFFSDPRNLARITPPELGFEIIGDLPAAISPGLMIEYRVRPLFGIPVTWLTEITQAEPPVRFVDEQRVGPYRIWHHEHGFRDLGDGRVELHDLVHYQLPAGPLGGLIHPWFVRPQLRRIFSHREKVVAELFG